VELMSPPDRGVMRGARIWKASKRGVRFMVPKIGFLTDRGNLMGFFARTIRHASTAQNDVLIASAQPAVRHVVKRLKRNFPHSSIEAFCLYKLQQRLIKLMRAK